MRLLGLPFLMGKSLSSRVTKYFARILAMILSALDHGSRFCLLTKYHCPGLVVRDILFAVTHKIPRPCLAVARTRTTSLRLGHVRKNGTYVPFSVVSARLDSFFLWKKPGKCPALPFSSKRVREHKKCRNKSCIFCTSPPAWTRTKDRRGISSVL